MILKRTLRIAALIVVLGAIAYLPIKKSLSAVEVTAEPLGRKTFEVTVSATATGTVKSDMEARVTAERIGRITKLLAEEGDVVKAGSVIAELDTEDALLNLKMSEAAHDRAKALFEEAKAGLDPFNTDVETTIRKAEANFREAGNRLSKYRELNLKGFVSSLELDAVERDFEVAKAAYDAALSGRKALLAKGEEVRAREAGLREAESSLATAKLNYGYSFIKSPIPGVVSSRPVKLGETVMKGALVATVTGTKSLYIEAFIDEADVGKVRVGQRVHIGMDAYPGKTFEGEIYMISPVVLGARHETRTFEVRTRLKEKGIVVKPGMSADIEIIVDKVDSALIVPSQAVMERDGASYVYVVEDGRAAMKKAETGLSDWTYTEITSGLKEGDKVILNPDAAGLRDGARVKTVGAK